MPILHWLNKDQVIKTAGQYAYRLLEALIPFYAGQVKCTYIDPIKLAHSRVTTMLKN